MNKANTSRRCGGLSVNDLRARFPQCSTEPAL